MKLLLLYLGQKGILSDMKNACERFLVQLNENGANKFPPLRYLLPIDVMDLFESFPELGEHMVKEPLRWQRYCSDILFERLKTLNNDISRHIKSSQVVVNIRLKSLPNIFRDSELRQYTGINSFTGLVINISKPTNYVFHTVWSCSEECEDNEVILQYIPKVPPKCCQCKSILFENSGLRMCGELVYVTFKLKNYLLPRKYSIVDDLIQKVKLGASYYINFVVLKKVTAVWCLEEITTYPAPTTSLVPPDIKKMLETCDNKPWKFIFSLASSIGVRVCPLNCFMNIKVNLLLSLTSITAHNLCGSLILHFLAIGYDTGYIAELMGHACRLAKSHVNLGTSNSNVATTLIGSSGGVCIMPLPLQVYNQKQVHSIMSTIESGEIHHETNSIKLNCAIWAYVTNLKKKFIFDYTKIFGIICRIDYGDYADELADFILQQAIDPPKVSREEKQALNDISVYIDLVGGLDVCIEENCKNVLGNYFLAARKARTNSIPIGNMESLVTTCAISARLCRRIVASIDDAVFAIWLHVCSMSDPRIAPEECIQMPTDIRKLHSIIENFVDWLEQFTGCIIANNI